MKNSGNILRKINSKLRWMMNDFLITTKLKKFKNPKSPIHRILVYHGIDKIGNKKMNSRFFSASVFEEHLIFYKTHFNVVSLAEYYKNNFDRTRPTVCLTFDDGYSNNLHNALPLLEKHKIPATFFITTIRDAGFDLLWPDALDLSSHVSDEPFELMGETFIKKGKRGYYSQNTDKSLKETTKTSNFIYKTELLKQLPGLPIVLADKQFDEYRLLLKESEIKQLSDSPLVSIGSHGYYHNCLERIPLTDAKWEMKHSKDYLEKITGKKITTLAFPDGRYSGPLIKSAMEIGYNFLLAGDLMDDDVESDILKARFTLNPHISVHNQMQSIINGSY